MYVGIDSFYDILFYDNSNKFANITETLSTSKYAHTFSIDITRHFMHTREHIPHAQTRTHAHPFNVSERISGIF